jgi:two-component system sensor histidine kinase/response regulator
VAAAISGRLAARTGWSQHLLRWRHQNGSFRFLEGSAVAILDDAGTVAGWRGVDHDVTESRRLQEDLQVATAAAEAASRAKSEFLANMSHEIRTPMNGIIGMVELLLGTSVSPEQRDYLELVRNSADRLLEVINDILDFSRVEARRLELDARPFFLRECVAQTVGALAVSADAKGLELSFRVAAGLPDHLVGDDGRLRQILVNLIGNAIKFTEQGEVAVEFQQEWQRDGKVGLHVIVRDTGVGVAPDRQEAIFSPFTQGDGTTRRRFGGTGLGLSISSRLVGLMEGRIWVESELGRGSAFHFTACFGTADGDALAPPLANLASLQGTPILVVDDQPTNRRLLEEMLRRWGFAPASAAGGEEALAALRDARREERSYRLVVLDVQMPVVDGFEVVRRMREDPALAPITVMMLSSGGRADEAARCRELGAVPYVVKPVDPSRLLTTIMTALGSPVGEASRRDPLPPSRGRPLRILVAEDNATNQRLVRAILEKHGHQVVLARDGREAVAAAHRGGLDLALVDVQMPELDGFQATAAIRAAETGTTRHLPIVALTAHALKGDREACLAAGMDDYLAKPIHTAELLATIDRVGSRQEPAPARHPRPPFDPEQVLARVEGDQALLSELVDIFRTEIPGLLATLERALEADDQRAVQDAAHAIKGCVGTIGGRVAADAALAIEDLGRAGNLKEAGAGFEALAQEVARLEGGLVRMRESARACDGA